PNLESKYKMLIDNISIQLQNSLGITEDDQLRMVKESLKGVTVYITNILLSTTNTLSLMVQIPIYMFLFLIYRKRFKNFFESLLPNNDEHTWRKDISNVLRGYISGLLLVTLIVSILNTIGLLLLGIDHAIFFGVLSGI